MKTKRFIILSGIFATALALPLGGTAKSTESLTAQSFGSPVPSMDGNTVHPVRQSTDVNYQLD